MSTNRIAKFADLVAENADALPSSAVRGFVLNPLAPSLSPSQIQIYQTAFLKAQQELEAEQDSWGEWHI